MTHFSQISIDDLTIEEAMWLDKAAKHSYYGEDLRDLLERSRDGDLMLWRLTDPVASGLAGTRLIERKTGRELWIELLVGKNYLSRAREIHQAFIAMAKLAHATRVSGIAVRPGLAKLYEDILGVPPAATIFTEEV